MMLIIRLLIWLISLVELRLIIILCMGTAAILISTGLTAQVNSSRSPLKAEYLYNFSQFVQWPDSCFDEENTPFVIGIHGEDLFGNFIDELVSGEYIDNHPMVMRRLGRISDLNDCQIAFFSEKNQEKLSKILQGIESGCLLTVSDAEGFTRAGGMVELNENEERIIMKINLDAVKKAGLTVSPRLLNMAEIVNSENQ